MRFVKDNDTRTGVEEEGEIDACAWVETETEERW